MYLKTVNKMWVLQCSKTQQRSFVIKLSNCSWLTYTPKRNYPFFKRISFDIFVHLSWNQMLSCMHCDSGGYFKNSLQAAYRSEKDGNPDVVPRNYHWLSKRKIHFLISGNYVVSILLVRLNWVKYSCRYLNLHNWRENPFSAYAGRQIFPPKGEHYPVSFWGLS